MKKYAHLVCALCIIQFGLMFLFLLSDVYYALILLPFPLIGYFAGRKYKARLTLLYMIFLILIIGFRVFLILIVRTLLYSIAQGFCSIFDLGMDYMFYQFWKNLIALSNEEKQELIVREHGVSIS